MRHVVQKSWRNEHEKANKEVERIATVLVEDDLRREIFARDRVRLFTSKMECWLNNDLP
jgi:hypothetical protein